MITFNELPDSLFVPLDCSENEEECEGVCVADDGRNAAEIPLMVCGIEVSEKDYLPIWETEDKMVYWLSDLGLQTDWMELPKTRVLDCMRGAGYDYLVYNLEPGDPPFLAERIVDCRAVE